MAEIKLGTKLVGEIKGNFYVPDYQRGYRWGKTEVETLLNDINEYGARPKKTESENYCLQPVVVRNLGDKYELIDGQQRLTTLYLIYSFIKREYKPKVTINFSLEYETRQESRDFLLNPDETKKDDNIDYFHIYNAYQTIKKWFEPDDDSNKSVQAADDIYRAFLKIHKILYIKQ